MERQRRSADLAEFNDWLSAKRTPVINNEQRLDKYEIAKCTNPLNATYHHTTDMAGYITA